MLIDRDLYDKYLLDEDFAWWWSVTKLQSFVLKEGKQIRAVVDHEDQLHHLGGRSGNGFAQAKGMNIPIDEVLQWFTEARSQVEFIPSLHQMEEHP